MTNAPNATDLSTETLVVTKTGPVTTIVLDRPHRKNAATVQLWHDLHALLITLGRDDSTRVIVLTGAGDAFCSGADLADGNEGIAPRHWARRMEEVNEVCLALHALPQPTIAKVNGVAAGAGMNLALGCDLVVAAQSARFSEIFTKRGLSVDFGGSWVLPRLVGMHKAMELVLFADMVSAEEAHRIGLVNRVVPLEELDDVVDEWARRLAANHPIAMAASKRLLRQGSSSTLSEALAAEGTAQAVNFTTHDTIEAISAFIEKREPNYQGR